MALFEAALSSRLGVVAVQVGDRARAEQLLQDALTRADELSYQPGRAGAFGGARAPCRSRSKDSRLPPRWQATVSGPPSSSAASIECDRRDGRYAPPSEEVDVDRAQDAATTLLGRRAVAAAYEQGRHLSRSDLVNRPVST